MTENLKKFGVNCVIPVNFKLLVIANSKEEALRICEEKIEAGEVFCEYMNDSCGIDLDRVYESLGDIDDTERFETNGIEWYDEAEFSLDESEEPEDVELEFYEDEDEDEEEYDEY